jgi:imidazolonepropionase-like amidohydrolase
MLSSAGGKLLAGTDAGVLSIMHGASLHDELAHLSDAGLSNAEVLRIGTQAPAEYYAEEEVWGRIEVGHLADLVVVDKNPLQDVSATKQVFGCLARGKWHQSRDGIA